MVSLAQLQDVPPKNMILIVGPPGSGKSTFCEQTALHRLAMVRPIIYVTTKYGPFQAEMALRERGLGEVEPGLLNFVDAYNETVGVSVSDRADTVLANCNNLSSIDVAISKVSERIQRKDILLVFDSLTSPYLFNGSEILRFITQTLSRFAARGNAVMACVDEGCGKEEDLVAMMSLSNGVIRIRRGRDERFFDVVKHPRLTPTSVRSTDPAMERREIWFKSPFDVDEMDPGETRRLLLAMMRGDEAAVRTEVGDFVNLFWPNLVHWSGMLWDPKGFPMMKYELNREDETKAQQLIRFFPWHWRLFVRLFAPKNFRKVSDMKKAVNRYYGQLFKQERSGIIEYLEDVSRADEHYIRVHENVDCWGFEDVGAAMALYLPSVAAGKLKGFDREKRDWNAIETKCIGLGDPYCEFKLVPGEIDELGVSLEKDSSVIDRIHERLMNRLMGFIREGKPLVERPRLGSDVHFHVTMHVTGFPYMAGERYRTALRMGGAKAGGEVGGHLMKSGLEEDEAVKRILHLLEHCKVGKVAMDETIKIRENLENVEMMTTRTKVEEPSCLFTTGFLNGFFSTIKNQHVKETKCIAMGDPYCEWEFR